MSSPPPTGWTCASWNPGHEHPPARSTTSVPRTRRARGRRRRCRRRRSARPRTATACAQRARGVDRVDGAVDEQQVGGPVRSSSILSRSVARVGREHSRRAASADAVGSGERDQVQEVLAPVVRGRRRASSAPAAGASASHELRVVAHDHHRARPVLQRLGDRGARRRIEVVRRLVEQQQVLAARRRAGPARASSSPRPTACRRPGTRSSPDSPNMPSSERSCLVVGAATPPACAPARRRRRGCPRAPARSSRARHRARTRTCRASASVCPSGSAAGSSCRRR